MRKKIIILNIFILSACIKKADKEIFLIPSEFEGNIVMIYDSSNRDKNSFEGTSRLYKLDTTGIFISSLNKPSGLINVFFYYESLKGERENIEYIVNSENNPKLDSAKVYAFNNGGFTQEQKNKKIATHLFTICKPREFKNYQQDKFILNVNSGNLPVEKWRKDSLIELKVFLNSPRSRSALVE